MVQEKRSSLELTLVGLIYDAALDPELWPNFLKAIKQAMKSSAAMMVFYNHLEKSILHFDSVGIKSIHMRSYQNRFAFSDPILEAIPEWPDPVYRGDDMIDAEEWSKHEYLTEWLLPQGNQYQSGTIIHRDDARLGVISVLRTNDEGPYQKRDLDLLRTLQPHLSRAMQLNQKFWTSLSQPSAALSVLDNLEVGIILIDADSRPVYLNRYANTVLELNPRLTVDDNGLRASDDPSSGELETMVEGAVQTGRGVGFHNGGWLALGTGHTNPLFLLISPLRGEGHDFGLTERPVCAIVFFTSPDLTHALPINALKELFGLTPAEASIVRELDHGSNLDEIAQDLGISKHTARDHLKAIFRKTHTRRQAELLRLVLTSPSSVIRESDVLGIALVGTLDHRKVADRRLDLRLQKAQN